MKKTNKKVISVVLACLLCFQFMSLSQVVASAVTQKVINTTLNFAMESAPTGDLEVDGYHWEPATNTLEIKNTDFANGIILPDSDGQPYPDTKPIVVTIKTYGNCEMNYIEYSKPNSSYISRSANTTTIFDGPGVLTVTTFFNSSQADTIIINEGATVLFKEQFSVGTSGGIDGRLTVNGKMESKAPFGNAVTIGYLKIGSTGSLKVTGDSGVSVNGGSAGLNKAFVLEDGGLFTSSCTDGGIFVFSERTPITAADIPNIFVCPKDFIPTDSKYELKIITGENGADTNYALVLAPKSSNPILDYGTVIDVKSPITLGYKFTSGQNSTWDKTHTDGLTFRVTADLSIFEGLTVDGKTVERKDYTTKQGSTIVTLSRDFLLTLSEGDHRIGISYTGGEALAGFKILHVHSYGTDWKTDSANHWHECSCGDKTDVAAHTFETVVDKVATEDATGLQHKHCTVCGYDGPQETIPKLPHVHVYGTDWKTDSANHWHECSCGDKTDVAAHTFETVVDKAATEDATGLQHKHCTVCGYDGPQETTPKLPHVHVYGTDWKTDGTNHWHECKCGSKTDVAEHTFETVVDKAATEDATGLQHKHCTVCGYDGPQETTPKLPHVHVYGTDWKTDGTNHWHECKCGSKTDVAEHTFDIIIDKAPTETETGLQHKVCSVCGYTTAQETVPVLPHTHNYGTDWKTDSTNHWHECSCGAKTDVAEHTFDIIIDKAPTETETGLQHKVCSVCGYTTAQETVPVLPHTHNYGTDWKTDSTNHWHECSCGAKTDVAEHTFEIVVDKAATETETGLQHKHCTVCGYDAPQETIPVVPHTHITFDENSPWSSDENGHWHECSCGDKFDQGEHSFIWVVDKEATVDEAGSKHQHCEVCGYDGPAVEIPKLTPAPVVPETEPQTEPPTKPETKPEVKPEAETEKPTENETESEVPKTGDNINVLFFLTADALAFAGLMVILNNKKKRNNNEA